jgi:hypothetical protein
MQQDQDLRRLGSASKPPPPNSAVAGYACTVEKKGGFFHG